MLSTKLKTRAPLPTANKIQSSCGGGSVLCFKKLGLLKCQQCSIRPSCLAANSSDNDLLAFEEISHHPAPTHKGDFFYSQGDTFNSLYWVRSGAVKSYHIDKNGQEHITAFHLSGELFGLDGLANGKHQNFAQALDTSTVCEINFKLLSILLRSSAELQQRMMEMISSEALDKIEPLLFLHHRPVEERLITFIYDMSSRYEARGLSATRFILPMSRRDIAHHLGTTEETISRLFSRIQRMGIVSVEKRTIIIKDLEKLKALSLSL